jgi:hypothetical protein
MQLTTVVGSLPALKHPIVPDHAGSSDPIKQGHLCNSGGLSTSSRARRQRSGGAGKWPCLVQRTILSIYVPPTTTLSHPGELLSAAQAC